MVPASAERFFADPVGRYVVGTRTLTWCASPQLTGVVTWGFVPENEALISLRAMQAATVDLEGKPTDLVIDVREQAPLPVLSENAIYRTFGPLRAAFVKRVRRIAIIGRSPVADSVEGLFSFLGFEKKVRIFSSSHEVSRWVAGSRAALELIEHLCLEQRHHTGALGEIRSVLQQKPRRSLLEVARVIGRSHRSLQRELNGAGTTFTALSNEVRLETAEVKLATTAAKLEVVALETGFRGAAQFCTWFRKQTGLTPTQFRSQHHAAQR